MTDNGIKKALEHEIYLAEHANGYYYDNISLKTLKDALKLINRQQTEIERLHDEVLKTRRKALLEAMSKFAGHSDYHGDTILCKLICMAEGKEVEIAKPLDKSKIKSEAVKEFAKRLKEKAYIFENGFEANEDRIVKVVTLKDIDNLLKEMVGDTE